MKKAIVLVGVPGSGKSTYAKKMNIKHFSSDFIRLELFGTLRKHHDPKDDKMVFDLLHDRVFNYSESLIYDATNISRDKRIELYSNFKKNGFIVEIHLVLEPQEIALFQNKRREFERIVPDYVITDMYKFMAAPRIGVDCDEYKIISQSTFLNKPTDFLEFLNFAKENGIVKTIKKYISAAYLAEFINIDSPHETPYHKESIDEHIDMCIANSNNTVMTIIAILHDLGKSVAKIKGHYKGHEMISSIYALRFFNEVKNIPDNINPTEIIESVLFHMLAHQGIQAKTIEKHKLDKSILQLIEEFRLIDEKSRII